MTRSRYTIAVILQSFGVLRKTRRLTDAAFELQLMQDGEELLGSSCWRETEEIEDLSMEYWNLRRIDREEQNLLSKLQNAEETLSGAQANRAELLDRSKDIGQEHFQERENLFEDIEKLSLKRDEIMDSATAIKRKHAALKMKAEVLKEENSDEGNLDQFIDELNTLKEEFTGSKAQLSATDAQIDDKEEQLATLQKEIDTKMLGSKDEATEAFTLISKANRDITNFRAELGLINDEQSKTFREIGRFLNLNAKRQDCRNATKAYRGLLEQTRLLYQSVQWNRKLAERASD